MSKSIQRANDIQTKTLMKLDQYLSVCKKNYTRIGTSVKPAKNIHKLNQIMNSIDTLKLDIVKYRNIKKNICLYFSNIKFFLAEARLKYIEIQKITNQLNKEDLNDKKEVLILKQCHIYCRELQTYILLFQTIAELEYKCKDQKQNVQIVQKMYHILKQNNRAKQQSIQQCQFCFDNKIEYIAIPCGHFAYCEQCKKQAEDKNQCFLCREPVDEMIKVYQI